MLIDHCIFYAKICLVRNVISIFSFYVLNEIMQNGLLIKYHKNILIYLCTYIEINVNVDIKGMYLQVG